jgi:hypothetical protein
MRTQGTNGRILSEKKVDTPRPHWVVEKQEFFDERALIHHFRDRSNKSPST